jgi:hypothetical protein
VQDRRWPSIYNSVLSALQVQVACCGQGPYNGIRQCTAASNVFADRDAFHPSERANRVIVGQVMHGGDTDYMHLSAIFAVDREGL